MGVQKTMGTRRRMRGNESFLVALVFGLCISAVQCEKGYFRVMLDPDSSVVHYSEGYLVAPGTIDLGTLQFQAKESIYDYQPSVAYSNANAYSQEDDDFIPPAGGETEHPPGEGGGGHHERKKQRQLHLGHHHDSDDDDEDDEEEHDHPTMILNNPQQQQHQAQMHQQQKHEQQKQEQQQQLLGLSNPQQQQHQALMHQQQKHEQQKQQQQHDQFQSGLNNPQQQQHQQLMHEQQKQQQMQQMQQQQQHDQFQLGLNNPQQQHHQQLMHEQLKNEQMQPQQLHPMGLNNPQQQHHQQQMHEQQKQEQLQEQPPPPPDQLELNNPQQQQHQAQMHEQQKHEQQKQQQQEDQFALGVNNPQQQQHQQQMHEQQKQQQQQQKEQEGRPIDPGTSQVDIAIVYQPAECANTRSGCDWVDLGVGAKSDDGDVRWCCAGDAMELGLCEKGSQFYGQLILNDNFKGTHRYVEIPSAEEDYENKGGEGKESDIQTVKWGEIEEYESGRYTVIFANCNDNHGREVLVTGYTVWESKHGYLPGELFHFMYFYYFIMIVYFVLFACYVFAMKQNEGSRIDLEKWIFLTILMGLLETFARSVDFMWWNHTGDQLIISYYIGVLLGVLKRAMSRCLIVMISLGWGVVRDSLGPTLPKIIALGIFYVGVSAIRDCMVTIAVEDVETLSLQEEDELFDVVQILTFLIAFVDVVFILWILDSLNGTMEYLENMAQTRKLMRYLRLRCIFLFSILFAVIWAVFSLVDNYDESGILEEQHEWVVDAATEVNYLFVLIAVALLWWPNPSAKDFAYQMELPSSGSYEGDEGPDGPDGSHELELTAGAAVPSALDGDDFGDGENGDKGSFDFAVVGKDDAKQNGKFEMS